MGESKQKQHGEATVTLNCRHVRINTAFSSQVRGVHMAERCGAKNGQCWRKKKVTEKRGSTLKGEKNWRKGQLNALKLQIGSRAKDMVNLKIIKRKHAGRTVLGVS